MTDNGKHDDGYFHIVCGDFELNALYGLLVKERMQYEAMRSNPKWKELEKDVCAIMMDYFQVLENEIKPYINPLAIEGLEMVLKLQQYGLSPDEVNKEVNALLVKKGLKNEHT